MGLRDGTAAKEGWRCFAGGGFGHVLASDQFAIQFFFLCNLFERDLDSESGMVLLQLVDLPFSNPTERLSRVRERRVVPPL